MASGATSTISGENPADDTADVIASTWSTFAATTMTDLSPFGVSPRIALSQTISSMGNGMFCSISYLTSWSNFSVPPAIGMAAARGNAICPEMEIATFPGRMPLSRTISRRAGGSTTSAFSASSGAARAARPSA